MKDKPCVVESNSGHFQQSSASIRSDSPVLSGLPQARGRAKALVPGMQHVARFDFRVTFVDDDRIHERSALCVGNYCIAKVEEGQGAPLRRTPFVNQLSLWCGSAGSHDRGVVQRLDGAAPTIERAPSSTIPTRVQRSSNRTPTRIRRIHAPGSLPRAITGFLAALRPSGVRMAVSSRTCRFFPDAAAHVGAFRIMMPFA